ncbi:OmpA family protein [Spirosoma oryzicola]|uniref:OmpA family protein n=1 Tax=Spirosoma oryzicola TaxID=2898794 RepID=UPI001E536C3D|nr:PA14 domain-containing protein [Spirosoma oryzicola]UHG92182.1 PA14 domain-containing protein [Spirosoma oryzicola]
MKRAFTFFVMMLWSGLANAQPGLKGEYYNGTNFEKKVVTRIDPTISFNWRNRNPAPGVNTSYHSVRWTGKLLAPYTGRYTFSAKVDDGIRLWVGNQKVLDVWQLNDSKSFTGSVSLRAGYYYDLRVDYFNDLLEGEIFLEWSTPDPKKQFPDPFAFEPVAARYFWQKAPPVAASPKPVNTISKTPSVKAAVVVKAKEPVVKATPKPVASVASTPVRTAKSVTKAMAEPNSSESSLTPTTEATLTLRPGETVVLHNVQFEQSSYVLLPESSVELNKLVLALKQNPQWQLEIGGHTDNVGDARLNRALSENRAKVVANYLIRSGIAEERIDAKGYGSAQPIADNTNEMERLKNRRVTIRIR